MISSQSVSSTSNREVVQDCEIGSITKNFTDRDFVNTVNLLTIARIELRIICSFIGVHKIDDLTTSEFYDIPIIAILVRDAASQYFKEKKYKFVGALNFDEYGTIIPVSSDTWTIKNKEKSIIKKGYQFYKSKQDSIVVYHYRDDFKGEGIRIYHKKETEAKQIIKNMVEYTKKYNLFKTIKLKSVDFYSGSFENVEIDKQFSWDNYYYSDSVKEVFDIEVLEFLSNFQKYKKYNIFKRGILMWGAPGVGKTTLGKILCNCLPNNAVLWITPDMISAFNGNNKDAISYLYKLADFMSPLVVFLEDIDLFGESRSSSTSESLGSLMNVLDGINSVEGIITIATTNKLEFIENALKNRPGRFDRVVEIENLNDDLRSKMFKKRLKNYKYTQKDFDEIVKKTHEWTPAKIQEFINTLNLIVIQKAKKTETKTSKCLLDQKMIKKSFDTLSLHSSNKKGLKIGFINT